MKNRAVILSVLAAVAVAAVFIVFSFLNEAGRDNIYETGATPLEEMSWFETIDSEREIEIHCGNSMRVVMEIIADEFQKTQDIAVIFNFGGSAELLPLIEFGGRGDLYICHDPYAEILAEKELLEDYIVLGRLEPVILVQKGNPGGIQSLSDLAGGGIRIASVDPRYATAGRMLHEVLEREEWGESVRNNILVESRGHSDAALALLTGHADAAVVWNFLSALYSDSLDEVSPGVDFQDEIRVTLCRLSTSENVEETALFMEFAVSDFAREAFKKFGYINPG